LTNRIRRVCWGRRSRDESGQSLVEFALVAPILLLLVLGIFWFATTLNNWLVMTDATRSAARALAVARGVPNICPPAGQGACTAPADPCAQTVTNVKNGATDLNTANLTITVTPLNCANGVLSYNSDVTVQAQYPCENSVLRVIRNLLGPILGPQFVPNCKLTTKMVDRIE
jgi:Flp pilus assembly protein TadG